MWPFQGSREKNNFYIYFEMIIFNRLMKEKFE